MSVNGDAVETETPAAEPEEQVAEPETTPETPVSEEVTPIDRPTRAQRRVDRAAENNARREAEELRRTLEEERKARQSLESSVSEMRGYLQRQRETEQQARQTDDTDRRIQELRRRAKEHLVSSSQARDQAIAEREFDRYQETLEEIAEIRAERRLAPKLAERNVDHEAMAGRTQLLSEFPALATDRAFAAASNALAQQWVSEGKPATIATARAAAAEMAKRMGIGGNGGPSQQSRGAYSGIASRQGEGSVGAQQTKQHYNPATMTREQKRLAEQTFPKLDPEKAHKAWAAGVNARLNGEQ